MIIFRRVIFAALRSCFLIIIFFFSHLFSDAQSRSKYELFWAFTHPLAAVKAKHIGKNCHSIYRNDAKLKVQLDSFLNGGKLDAFRHVFFMAAFSQKIKIKKLRKLGEAHEKGNHKQFLRLKKEEGEVPDSLSTIMDLANNETGFILGSANKKMELEQLKELVISEIKQGKTLIMNRQKNGTYMDCGNKPLNLLNYIGVWSVPKCLVSSDLRYR